MGSHLSLGVSPLGARPWIQKHPRRFELAAPPTRRPITSGRMDPGESSGSGGGARSTVGLARLIPLAPHLPESRQASRGEVSRHQLNPTEEVV